MKEQVGIVTRCSPEDIKHLGEKEFIRGHHIHDVVLTTNSTTTIILIASTITVHDEALIPTIIITTISTIHLIVEIHDSGNENGKEKGNMQLHWQPLGL